MFVKFDELNLENNSTLIIRCINQITLCVCVGS